MTFLILDVETLGTEPNRHSLVQIAAELHVDRKVVASFNQKISQDSVPVDLGALKVNKVKMQELSSYGNPEPLVVREFVDFLLDINSRYKDIILCGHNIAGFDVQFLTQLLAKYNITNIGAVLPYRVLDTSTIGLFLNSIGILNIEKFNSENLFKYLEVNVKKEDLHDALADVKATAEALYKMQDLVKNLRFDHILQHKEEYKTALDSLVNQQDLLKEVVSA